MPRRSFYGGLSQAARAEQSLGRDVPSPQQQLGLFQIGIVMDDFDEQRMGQVWVYLPGISARRYSQDDRNLPLYGGTTPDRNREGAVLRWDQKLRLGWIRCAPLLPFFGGDDYRVVRSPGGDIRNASSGDVNSYGFWAQPRIGDYVGILFANGDPQSGYWIGMPPKFNRNFMVPGSPGRPPNDLDEKQDNQGSAIHKLTRQIKQEATQTSEPSLVPAFDKARRLNSKPPSNGEDLDENRAPAVDRELIDVLANPDFALATQKAGLLCDPIRGAGNSSSRRESPSYVTGMKSAGWNFDSEKGNLNTGIGSISRFQDIEPNQRYTAVNSTGHQFVMDDHPDFQGMRLRSSAGSQIYFSDRCNQPFIYISTAEGNVWIEINDDGKINIYAEDSISVHARKDINITADRDLNIDVQRDLNMQVRRNTVLKMKGRTDWELGKNDLPPQFLNYEDEPDWGTNTSGNDTQDSFIQSFGNLNLTIGNTDSSYILDPGGNAQQPKVSRDFCMLVSNDLNWTIGDSVKIDIGHDDDFGVGGAVQVGSGSLDIDVGGPTRIETDDSYDLKSATTMTQESGTLMSLKSGANIQMTAAPDIHLNSPGNPASSADSANNPSPCTEPNIPGTDLTFNAPTEEEIKFCKEPPADFRTLRRMTVPQHQPYPERCKLTLGLTGFIDESPTPVSRSGSSAIDSDKPLNLPEESKFREAQPFSTNNLAEKPIYDDLAPRGIFASCNTYTTSEKGIDFLKRQEGIRTKAYRDADGFSIGHGHFITVGDVINGDTINGRVTREDLARLRRTGGDLNISRSEADRLFRQDLQKFEQAVCNQVNTNITQGQFDAMVSYAYNGGEGALRRMVQRSNLNSGDFSQVPQEWMKLSTCSRCDPAVRPRIEAVLRRRRQEELEQLFSQV